MPRVVAHLIVLALLATLTACTGAATVTLPNRTRPGNVYLFAGAMGYGSDAMRLIAKRLANDGYNAQVLGGSNWSELPPLIAEARTNQELSGPIVLVGYSWGGLNANDMAHRLQTHGINVDAFVVVDGFAMPPIAPNVNVCCNLYLPGMMSGTVRAESPDTKLTNLNLNDLERQTGKHYGFTHWDVTAPAATRELIEQTIREYLPASR